MVDVMALGILRLKGRELLERYGRSMYRVGKDGEIAYPTAHKYMSKPEDVLQMHGEVLYGIFTNGLGLSIEEAKELTLGDVFDFVPYPDKKRPVAE